MFIFVYRLAMDAKTLRGDGVGGLKYLSLLKDFLVYVLLKTAHPNALWMTKTG